MSNWKRDDKPIVTPRIICKDVDGMVRFLSHVFNATSNREGDFPAEVTIGDCLVTVSEGGGGLRESYRSLLYVYVPDADATYARAIHLGAVSIEEPNDQFYGDRRAMFADPWGNGWQVASKID